MSEEGARPEPSPPLPPRFGLALAVLTGLFQGTALLFLAALGAFLFHVVVAGVSLTALAGSAFVLFVGGLASRKRLAGIGVPSNWI